MAIEIDIEMLDVTLFHEAIAKYSRRGKNLRPVWQVISDDFYRLEKEAFDGGGARSGFPAWTELSDATKRWKKRHAPGAPIMEVSGELKASLTRPDAKHSLNYISSSEMEIGTKAPYAKYHQKKSGSASGPFSVVQIATTKQAYWMRRNLGTATKKGDKIRLPRRYIVRLSKDDQSRWLSYIHTFFENLEGTTKLSPKDIFKGG